MKFRKAFCALLGAIAITASATVLAGCTTTESKDTIVFGLGSDWATFKVTDFENATTHQVGSQIYDKLVYVAEDYSVEPRGAKSWSWSDDGTVLTFNLDESATWHDGEPVTAEDYVFTLQYYSTSEVETLTNRSFVKRLTGTDDSTGIETDTDSIGAVATDTYTLTLTLSSAYNQTVFLASTINSFYVLPQHCFVDEDGNQLSDTEIDESDFWSSPIGSGPYEYVSSITGQSVTLKAHEGYQLGTPAFETLIMQVIDTSTAVDKILAGDVDILGFTISEEVASTYAGTEGVTILAEENPSTQLNMVFNCQAVPQNIRQAIRYGINKQDILDRFYASEGQVIDSVVYPTYPGSEGIQDVYDVETAQSFVDAAEEAGEWDTENDSLVIGVVTSTNESIATVIGSYLDEIGINVTVKQAEMAVIQASMMADSDGTNTTYHCAIWSLGASYYPASMFTTFSLTLSGYGAYDFFHLDTADAYTPLSLYTSYLTATEEAEKTIIQTFQAWEDQVVPQVTIAFYSAYSATSSSVTGADVFNSTNWNHASWNWALAD